jgi:outer membrane autotransporter protein
MSYRSPMQRAMARLSSFICRPHAWLLMITLLALLPNAAQAACGAMNVPDAFTTPSTSPMVSGGTITISVGIRCDGFGLNPYPGPGTANPSHGTVSVDTITGKVIYTNNGDGATSDSFVVVDSSAQPFTVNVAIGAVTSPITVSPASLPTPHVGTAYSQTLSASGGTAPYSYAVTSGSLPPGLSLSGATISGTPNQAGGYTATITVTDNVGTTGTKSYTANVPIPTIAIAAPPTANLNAAYSYDLNANTSGALASYTYVLLSGSLPPGLSLSGGVISGTPTTVGTSSFVLHAVDSSPNIPGVSPGPYASNVNLSITVQNVPPTAGSVSATVAYGSTNNPITLNLTDAPATSVAVATAAAHGTATASGTSISYTPTSGYAGPDSFTYTATNGAGSSSPATVTITVSPPTILYTPAAPPHPTAGVAYNHSIANASGGAAPYTYTMFTGVLPAGLTLASNGTISGTSAAVGTFTFKVVATDNSTGTGPFTSAPANVTLIVDAPIITLAPSTLPGGTVNTAYSQTITATGGTAPYTTYTVIAGTLPTGITLSSGGVLSGTPTQAGSFNITVTATDSTAGPSAPYSGSRAYTLTIAGPTITLAPASVPNATVGTAYTRTVAASGGTAPYTFSTTGSVPPGLSISSSGTLSGTPTTAGDFLFSIVATDAQSFTGSRTYIVQVTAIAPGAPTIGTATAGDASASVSFTPPTNDGGTPITSYTVTSSPGGITASGAGSPITATGLTNGTAYAFTVTATNSAGSGGTSAPSNSVTPQGAQTVTFNNPGTTDFGVSPQLVATATSTLAVTFTSTTAAVCTVTSAGILTTVSPGTCSIDANQAGNGAWLAAPAVTQAFAIVVPDGAVSFATGSPLPDATSGVAYSQTITAVGGATPYTFTQVSGTLPAGMTFDPSGVLSGTPSAVGTFNVTLRVTDAATQTADQNYQLVVDAPVITLAPASLSGGTVGQTYAQNLTASGGTAPYTFAVTAGVLPAGLTLNSAGALSGTPTTAGDFNFTAVATDAQSFTGSRAYAVHVAAIASGAPTIGTATAGDTSAIVSFTPPASDGGTPITGYTVTSSPGGITASGAGSPITVAGLTNGTAYTFTVTATNSAGTGAASATSNSVTPKGAQTITFNNPGTQNFGTTPTLTAMASSGLTPTFTSSTPGVCTITSGGALTFIAAGACAIDADQPGNGAWLAAPTVTQSFTVGAIMPGVPTIGTATAGDASATVSFTAPANSGGAAITGYTVTSSPDGLIGSGAASPITVTGLTNGTAYTFTVTATNSAGPSGTSAPSNSVTPQGAQTITFNNPGATNFGVSPQLVAAASSNLAVIFTSTTATVCTVTSTGVLTTVSPGTCSIDVNQAGDGTWLAAPTVTQAFAIVVAGGAVSFTTGSPLPNATGGVAYSQTIAAAGGATPYTFTLVSGALPTGMTFSPSGVLAGTPLAGGTFNFTLRATDTATQTADQSYQLVVDAPAITLAPASLPGGTVGRTYAQNLTASGGTAPYTYAVTAGVLPAGLTLNSAGALSGTPTTAGSFNATVTTTDQHNFLGTQNYTIVIGEPAPAAVDDSANVNANGAATITVTGNDNGPITSIAITRQPAHGTAAVNGLNITYTPAHDYFGSDTFKYTATGPGGTSVAATVSITVVAGATPVVTAQSATVLAGQSVTIHAATGAGNGPFTVAAVVNAPVSGTATVQGTDIVYTADDDAAGTLGFDYTLSNAFGTSSPAHVTLTINPRPMAPALTATATAGTTVQVDLVATAHGGPFTAAEVVSVSPANAGTTAIKSTSAGHYTLAFTAAATFGGVARVTYTLSNAFATSAPGTVDVTVQPRSDPSKNAEVLGVLEAQAEAARRMAMGQIGNFQRRLESLHGGGSRAGFSNGITMNSASSLRRADTLVGMQRVMGGGGDPFLAPADEPVAERAPSNGTAQDGVAFWTGGAVNFGKLQPGASYNGVDFTTSGLSLGADKQVTQALALGLGVGYGHDASDIGQYGSRSTVDGYNVAAYGSYQPGESAYMDVLVGYQWLQFDARRFVTDNGNTVRGSRDGKQWFASFSVGYRHQADDMMLTPYGRLDVARATLDGYTETGDTVFALSYQGQTVKTSTGTVGLLAQWTVKRDYGVWAPQLRAEFGHDLQGSSQATMHYADLLSGPLYQATLARQSRNHTLLGAGIALQTLKGWSLRVEYQNQLDNTSRDNQSILLGVQKTLPP